LLAGIALTVLIGSVGFESWRRRRVRLSAAEEDELALALLRHVVQHPAQGDPLMVRERPFFRTTKGRRLSLARLEKLARAGRLFAAYPGAALLEYIQSSTPILDRSDSRVEHFREHLPDLVLLDPLAHLLDDSPRPPVLAEVERILNRVDSRVIVHASPGDDEIREVYLPTIAGRLPRLHITVGLGDPEVQRALNLYARASGQARFILLKRVLERTTIFLPEADVLLGKLAQEVLP